MVSDPAQEFIPCRIDLRLETLQLVDDGFKWLLPANGLLFQFGSILFVGCGDLAQGFIELHSMRPLIEGKGGEVSGVRCAGDLHGILRIKKRSTYI
jgi:hypothetical protein